MSSPTFVVAGAARCGTTALIEGLRRHPRVFVTVPKEPHYFALHGTQPAFTGPGDATMINARAVVAEDEYLALYPDDVSAYEAVGEGSTSTLYYYERAIPEIERLAPDAQVLVMLREPVARAQSAYDFLVSRGYEGLPSLLDAVRAEPQRTAEGYHHLWHYEGMGHYAQSLAAFRDVFGPDRLRVIFQDDLSSNGSSTMVSALRFIGTTPEPGEDGDVATVNAAGAPRSRALSLLVHHTASRPWARKAFRAATTWEQRERFRRALLRQRVGVPWEVRKELGPRFAAEKAQLRALLPDLTGGRPLPEWLGT